MRDSTELNPISDSEKNPLTSVFYNKKGFIIVCFAVIGFILPMTYGLAKGLPVPFIHDEFSYILMADTFADGRITNPTPYSYEHFESPHIMYTPSYTSKYPPMQGLFLAAGQVLFGHPIFGVWLSCGVAAAALFWMLLAWTPFRWAFLGTVLFVFFVGVNSYWAQSYWGGMVAATGGAFFFGGFRRLFTKLSYSSTLVMTLGGVILINSRPFEGLMTMLPALFVLLVWLLRDRKNSYARKFLKVVLPGAFLTVIALSAMAFYNFKVTGNAITFPYTVHQRQYHPAPLFIFQTPYESATKGHPRLRKLYDYLLIPNPSRTIELFNLPNLTYLYPFYGILYLLFLIPYFLLSPPLVIFLYITAFLLMRKDKWLGLMLVTILFTFVCMSVSIAWDNFHYAASLTCCFYLLIVEGFQLFIGGSKKGIEKRKVAILLTSLVLLSFYYQLTITSKSFMQDEDLPHDNYELTNKLTANEPFKMPLKRKLTYLKQDIEQIIEKLPGNFIAIVSYDEDFTFLDEMVFNRADIENSKLIWAYDLGEEKNKALLDHYQNRQVLRIKVSDSSFEINPARSN